MHQLQTSTVAVREWWTTIHGDTMSNALHPHVTIAAGIQSPVGCATRSTTAIDVTHFEFICKSGNSINGPTACNSESAQPTSPIAMALTLGDCGCGGFGFCTTRPRCRVRELKNCPEQHGLWSKDTRDVEFGSWIIRIRKYIRSCEFRKSRVKIETLAATRANTTIRNGQLKNAKYLSIYCKNPHWYFLVLQIFNFNNVRPSLLSLN